MVESKVVAGAAILASKTVAEKNVESRKRWMTRGLYVGFEGDNGGKTHFEARTSNRLVVMGNDVHPVEEDRLDCILPRPQRERIIAEGPEIGVEHESWTGLGRYEGLEVDRQIGTSLEARPRPEAPIRGWNRATRFISTGPDGLPCQLGLSVKQGW